MAHDETTVRVDGVRRLPWRCWPVVLGLFSTLSVGACRVEADSEAPSEGASADKYYQIALGSFHNGMLADAKVQLRRVFEVEAKHADARYLHGLILLDEGRRMVESLSVEACVVDEAGRRAGARADDLHRLAYAEFKAASESAEDKTAAYGRAMNSMAAVSLHLELHQRALVEARAALGADLYGERYSAYANLGWALHREGRPIEAITELRQSLLLNPDFCVARYRLAQVYLERDLQAAAEEEIERVLADARCPIQDAHRIHGLLRIRSGNPGEAQQAWQHCVALAPASCLAQECETLAEMASSPVE